MLSGLKKGDKVLIVDDLLATGGTGMVTAAYSCGKPALGVGPGNVPCYIEKSAKLKTSVNDLVMSKSFDNGMICASEQAVIVDNEITEEFEKLMKEYPTTTLGASGMSVGLPDGQILFAVGGAAGVCVVVELTVERNQAIIIESFGVGGLPEAGGFYESVCKWMAKGRTVVLTVMKRHEGVLLRRYVRQVDPQAFVLILNTCEIVGKGFLKN